MTAPVSISSTIPLTLRIGQVLKREKKKWEANEEISKGVRDGGKPHFLSDTKKIP